MKSTSKAAVILPHGVLFRGNAEATIRKEMVKRGYIKSVIDLPTNLFYRTGIQACIIVLRKNRPEQHINNVLIINANEIFTTGRVQNTFSNEQADEIYIIYQEQRGAKVSEIEGVARWAPLTEIEENDFNLNIALYVQKPVEEESLTVEEALKDFQSKLAVLEQAEEKLEALLIKERLEL